MKTKLFALVLLGFTLPLLAQPGRGQRRAQTNPSITLPLEPLSVEEEGSLYLMREEEKLARDVYQALFEKWELAIFSNIASSEQRHTDRIKYLLDRYQLSDPFIDQPGVFSDAHLQELYTALVVRGSASQLEALMVGATIEDLDIHDLDNLLPVVDNADITQVYENLLKGSRNHMRAFVSQIEAAGGTYTAQYISQEALEEILTAEMERGPMSGKGKGGRKGYGSRPGAGKPASGMKSIKVGNYPNPANPTTTIVYQLEETNAVELTIFNNLGQVVRSQSWMAQNPGEHHYTWDGHDAYGNQASSGIYYCRVRSGDAMAMHRMLLMR